MSDPQHTFELTVDAVPGAIERVLAVVRRRHLGVRTFRADASGDGQWQVSIRAGAPPKDAALALGQFSALIDVRHARVSPADDTASQEQGRK